MKPKVIDLFAGCGGLSYGFTKAGYDVVGFVEYWKPAITTFIKNHPNAEHLGTDITEISNKKLLKYKGKVDFIIGGPPCQGFSICGKRNLKDKRNQLYKEFLRFVRIIDPNTVVLENVPGLLSMNDYDNEKIINKILQELINLDYFVSYKVLTASDYNVPQSRKRLFIVAKKLDVFPKPSKKKKTTIEAIKDVSKDANAHLFFDTKQETIERIKRLKQGGRLSERFNFSRQRLHANLPSKTITTKPTFIHPYHDRFLTPRELARLQSFPDDFYFCGTRTDMVKQIGNAVPPLLAETIANNLGGRKNG